MGYVLVETFCRARGKFALHGKGVEEGQPSIVSTAARFFDSYEWELPDPQRVIDI